MTRFDLRPYQEEFLAAVRRDFLSHQRLLGIAATGCHAAGTRILMFDGSIKAVEAIDVGDLLMGPDSRPRQVLRLIRGVGPLWRIVPTKGQPFVINEDHILTLIRTNDGKQMKGHLAGYIKDVCFRDWQQWDRTQKHLYKLFRVPVRFPDTWLSTDSSALHPPAQIERTGFTAEPLGEGAFFGFTLDDDGRYLLDDFTVTHNSGKTILASELMRGWKGNCLFLADAQELVRQNADKFSRYSGEFAGVEMADSKAQLCDRVVVATTQSICRRLEKWPQNYFSLVIVDEAHRNTLGTMAAQVLQHFGAAKVLGVTATPFRSDRQQLGSFYEKISIEISLARLIKEGWLARILIKSVPLPIDLSQVRTKAGDYDEGDLGDALTPHLRQAARLVAEHAKGRRTVAFLPLIASSKAFVAACQAEGIRAVHVDGNEREGLRAYERGEFELVSNASLLTTGWDHPATDCVFILRPTKSLSLFQQMVGRGTRIAPGKENLLLLDPLFLTDDHTLIKPARLIAHSEEEAGELGGLLEGGGEIDLLAANEQAVNARASRLSDKLKRVAHRQARTLDALEFCLSLQALELAEYEPECAWEGKPPSDRQLAALAKAGLDTESIHYRGHASKILDLLFTRRAHGLATPKQVHWLRETGHPNPETATLEEASAWLSQTFERSAV